MSRLAKMQRGRINRPLRYVIYGQEGVGKSTIAADAPNAIVLDIEDGTSHLDVFRYTWRDDEQGHVPKSYSEILSAIQDLRTGEHDRKTLVIDTVDRLEAMLWAHCCERDSTARRSLSSIEDYGYQRGHQVALDEWRRLVSLLDDLRLHRNMSIILVGHTKVVSFRNPEGEDYERYQIRLYESKNVSVPRFLSGWADIVSFVKFDDIATQLNGKNGKTMGVSTGRRIIHTRRSAAYDAKTRVALPAEIELGEEHPWAPFAAAISDAESDPTTLVKLIDTELDRIGDEDLTAKVRDAIDNEGAARLPIFLASLKGRPSKTVATTTEKAA